MLYFFWFFYPNSVLFPWEEGLYGNSVEMPAKAQEKIIEQSFFDFFKAFSFSFHEIIVTVFAQYFMFRKTP